MAKEIVTHSWCDLCLGVDENREPATQLDQVVTLGLGKGAKPLSLDLCERHHKELFEPLLEALSAFGAPVMDPSSASRASGPRAHASPASGSHRPGPFRCMVPDCASVLANTGSLGSHLRQTHGLTMKDYRKQHGDPVRLAGEGESESASGEPGLFEGEQIGAPEASCPYCDKVYSHANGNNRPTQALGLHLARAHGIKGGSGNK